MTSEEIARAVVKAFPGDEYWIDTDAATAAVSAALDAYAAEQVAAERARLAERCEELTRKRAAEMGIPYDHLTGWQCAALVRDG